MILLPHNRGDLSAAQWKRIAPLLPTQKPTGRTPKQRPSEDYQWHLVGSPFRVLPGGISQSAMVLGRLSQDAFIVGGNREYGARLFQRLQQQADQSGKINWELHFIDGSVIRAHQHAAGAIRGEVEPNSELSAVEQVHYS